MRNQLATEADRAFLVSPRILSAIANRFFQVGDKLISVAVIEPLSRRIITELVAPVLVLEKNVVRPLEFGNLPCSIGPACVGCHRNLSREWRQVLEICEANLNQVSRSNYLK